MSKIKQFLSVTLLSLASSAALAQGAAKLVPAQSEIAFVSKQMGVPVEGKFKKFDAQVMLDPKQPDSGKVALTIDVGSASLGVPETDVELPKAPWFNAARFPQASFQSSAIKNLGGGKFEVKGLLNIKGNARELVVPVSLTQQGAGSIATGAFTIKRLDFRIGEGEWTDTSMVANDVQVKFKLALTGIAPL
jgi:polyisoprenoid-binding protein YceI